MEGGGEKGVMEEWTDVLKYTSVSYRTLALWDRLKTDDEGKLPNLPKELI